MLMSIKERISITQENGRTTIVLPPRRHALVIGSALLASAVGMIVAWVGLSDIMEYGPSSIFTWETSGSLILGSLLTLSILMPLWSIFGKETLVVQNDRLVRTRAALGWRSEEVFERAHYQNAKWVDGDLHDFASMTRKHKTPVSHIRLDTDGAKTKICEGTSKEEGERVLAAMGVKLQEEQVA